MPIFSGSENAPNPATSNIVLDMKRKKRVISSTKKIVDQLFSFELKCFKEVWKNSYFCVLISVAEAVNSLMVKRELVPIGNIKHTHMKAGKVCWGTRSKDEPNETKNNHPHNFFMHRFL